jgi:hypothetical protein
MVMLSFMVSFVAESLPAFAVPQVKENYSTGMRRLRTKVKLVAGESEPHWQPILPCGFALLARFRIAGAFEEKL